jgi:CDP-glycerol glycerophosphotransferase (TagB/SpsB family)
MLIGFLFNHDQVHQIAHSLPVAIALTRSGVGAEIIVATTNRRLSDEVVRLGEGEIGKSITLVELALKRGGSRVAAATLGAIVPATKLLIYRDNLDFFRSLDILVVAEKTSLVLKTRYGLDRLKIVHTRHGAGDRAIGFDKASTLFDHVLVSGPKISERLIAETGVDPARISMVGYPKFDMIGSEEDVTRTLPIGGRPVVVYNPHPSPHLSSWYRWGRKVLDWFVEHDEYYLIFAPHVMLFERPYVVTVDQFRVDRPGRIAAKYRRAPNLHIDLGSRASTTMEYTNRADIYVGDVSSQIYEFLIRPRPCLFLNPHRFDHEGDPNFSHWAAGPVIDDFKDFEKSLDDARAAHAAQYRPIQQLMVDRSFDLTNEPSSQRAARAIAQLSGLV